MAAKIVYDIAAMQCMNLFETLTKAKLKDCIMDEAQAVFVVEQNEIGKAIGKHGANVKALERALRKRVKLVEFHHDQQQFTRNLIAPLALQDYHEEEGVVVLTAKDLKTRGMLIGRNASHLRAFEAIVQRYFPLKELRVA